MKVYRNVIACAALALGTTLGWAAESGMVAEVEATGQGAAQTKVIQSRLDRLTKELQLNADQRAKVAAYLKEEKAALKLTRVDTSMADDVKKVKRREIAAACNAKIREVLNADQQAAFDQQLAKKKRKAQS
jgi:Spy/CpxP family protein refolding chaperone